MAAVRYVLVLSVAFGLVYASSDDAVDNFFGSDDECKNNCAKTYASLTDENETLDDSCKRGCRFFTILAFAHDNSDVKATRADCATNCGEAYLNHTEQEEACSLGCQNQLKLTSSSEDENPQDEDENPQAEQEDEPQIHLLYPLMYMHGVYSNMLDKVYRRMEVSWTVFRGADSGELVVVRSEPRIIDFVQTDMEDTPDNLGPLDWLDDKTSNYLETNIVGQDNSATPLLNFRPSQMGAAHGLDDGLQLDVEDRGDAERSDWLTCVAKKTGIARVVLCILILSTAVVMIWFCLSAATTAPEQHLSISGDLEYLRSIGEQEGFKLLHPQARVEARPLPVKIRVEQI